jgi:D-alanine-D-alanine ligase
MLVVGLTYDLKDDYRDSGLSPEEIAEFDSPATIAGLEDAVRALGFATDRIGHLRNLVRRLAAGESWDFVFNIAEGLRGLGRESEVPCLLDAFNIPYSFSDPMVLALCLHKGMTKRVVRDAGIPTADFAVLGEAGEARDLRLPFPLFAKPVAEGTGKGVNGASKVADAEQLEQVCAGLIERFRQPVLVETFLPGREFTVGIVGTGERAELIGSMEIIFKREAESGVYSYTNKIEYEQRMEYVPGRDMAAGEAEAVALAAYRLLGCRDGGRIDVRQDAAGRACFLEANPLAGLNPVHSDLPILAGMRGIGYKELIRRILQSGFERCRPSMKN